MAKGEKIDVDSAVQSNDFNTFNTEFIFKNEDLSIHASMQNLKIAEM